MKWLLPLLVALTSVLAFKWEYVEVDNVYPPNMLLHFAYDEGYQEVCRRENWASGRGKSNGVCHVPSGNTQQNINTPFEVLTMDPLVEYGYWRRDLNTAADIRDKGVEVKPPHSPEPYMFVCAHSSFGPGKLVVWSDTDFRCYVGHGNTEKVFTSGYDVLTNGRADEYTMTQVIYFFDDLAIVENAPQVLTQQTVENERDSTQVVEFELSYSQTTEYKWDTQSDSNKDRGLNWTIDATVPVYYYGPEIDIPYWGESTSSSTYETTYGDSASETLETVMTSTLQVDGRSQCVVQMVSTRMTIDVPYEGRMTSFFADGTSETQIVGGVHEGVSYNDDRMVVQPCTSLP